MKCIALSGTKDKGGIGEDICPTLTAEAEITKCVPIAIYAEKRFFEWHEDDISVTLRNKSGSYGGVRVLDYRGTVGSLCARDFKGVGNEYVDEGKLVILARSGRY